MTCHFKLDLNDHAYSSLDKVRDNNALSLLYTGKLEGLSGSAAPLMILCTVFCTIPWNCPFMVTQLWIS